MMNQSEILIFYLGFAFILMGSVSAAQIREQPYDVENDPDLGPPVHEFCRQSNQLIHHKLLTTIPIRDLS